MSKKIALFLVSLFCLVMNSMGQEIAQPSFSIKTDSTFYAANGSILAMTLVLENQGNTALHGKIELRTIEGLPLIGKEPIFIHLDAQTKLYYPIRLTVTKNVPAGVSPIALYLVDTSTLRTAEFVTKLIVQSKRQVQLIANRPMELMQQVGDSLTVSALLSNRGNSSETITVTASFPNLLGGTKVESKQVFLSAYQDSIITFKEIIRKELLMIDQYTVNIAALYEQGDLINNVMVSVQNVSGNRTYSDPRQGFTFDPYSKNRISLSGRNLFSQNQAMQLSAAGTYQLAAGSLDFNVDGYWYTQMNNRPLLTNTYLSYELNHKGITIGNFSENLETFVNGRGIKVYAGDEGNKTHVEVGAVDKTYNLLGDEHALSTANAYTLYAKTLLSNGTNRHYMGSVVYDRTPYTNSENLIQMNTYQVRLKANMQMGFELGTGLTRLMDALNASFKPSIAIGNSLSGVLGKYSINSKHFFSSGYYPGTRRGMVQVSERISRNFNAMTTWMAYSFYSYEPKYLQQQFTNYASNTRNSRLEVGASFPVSSNISMSLSAKRQSDRSRVSFFQDGIIPMQTLNAFRLTEALNWRSRNDQHLVYLSVENGFSTSPYRGGKTLQIRANGTWNYRFLSVNSYFQQGDFSLMDAYNNAQQGKGEQNRFNVSSGIRKEFFQQKLKTQVDLNYNRDSYSGSSWMYSGVVNYAFTPQFSAFANAYLYQNGNSYLNSTYSTIQAGLAYNLPAGRNSGPQKNGTISLQLFYDQNGNGFFDQEDAYADGMIATIGGISFISLDKGLITYKKVPYGSYSLQVPSQEWYAAIPANLNLESRELKLMIPLKKTSKLSGSILYKYDHITSEEVVEKYAGLRILVSNAAGFSMEAGTNSRGDFTLFIPVGRYELKVDERSLPKNVYTDFKPQSIQVMEGKPTQLPAIELKVKQRNVEIKRFTSE